MNKKSIICSIAAACLVILAGLAYFFCYPQTTHYVVSVSYDYTDGRAQGISRVTAYQTEDPASRVQELEWRNDESHITSIQSITIDENSVTGPIKKKAMADACLSIRNRHISYVTIKCSPFRKHQWEHAEDEEIQELLTEISEHAKPFGYYKCDIEVLR